MKRAEHTARAAGTQDALNPTTMETSTAGTTVSRPVRLEHVERLRRLTKWMDEAVGVPGTRVRLGLDGVLGLLAPGAGDAVGGAVSVYAMYAAARLGAGPAVLLRMALNVGLDALVGVVPLLGDLFDFAFKANRRNLRLLESFVADPGRTRAKSRVAVWLTFGALALGIVALLAVIIWGLGLLFNAIGTVADRL